MNKPRDSYKLIMGGNTNVPAMINCIIRSALQLRTDTGNDNYTFRQVHIFHTEQSLQSLITEKKPWKEALEKYGLSPTNLVHHVAKLEDSSVERFRDMVEQLRTIVNPNENVYYYVDLTGGISSLQAILAVFSYVLDIENIYTLETVFASDEETRKIQRSMFYHELEEEMKQGRVKLNYKKFPPIRDFDDFGKLNYTEVLRHRRSISSLMDHLSSSLNALISTEIDLSHLQTSFMSGINSRLLGESKGDFHEHQNAIYSFSHSVEEITNIIILSLMGSETKNRPLGNKLEELRSYFSDKPKYFVNEDILKHFTHLIAEVRNKNAHSSNLSENSLTIEIQSYLASYLAFTFLKFTIRVLSDFVDNSGNLLDIQIIDPLVENANLEFYFGFDGDATGKYLEIAFGDLLEDEEEVLRRSKSITESIKQMRKIICGETKNPKSVIFAEGDNILFKSKYNSDLLRTIQNKYTEITGLSSSIGYGKTLKEATIALRLAKARKGNSVVGVALNKEM
ncbi:MAG: mCpol domain-containing protein [Limnoraphis sp. WC205]|jgi:hypothetical protein|nr:mCpol domain-containing protein [Limnoraphis sp. WC205]